MAIVPSMRALDWINIAAILISPVIAVVVTLWWQWRKEKRDAKAMVFSVLMQYRKAYPPERDFARALNVIDVVFAKNGEVRRHWRDYFTSLNRPPTPSELELRERALLDMLYEMAKDLGYGRLIKQTDIDSFYAPQFFADQFLAGGKVQQELLRVLEATERIVVEPRTGSPAVSDRPR